ncbi:MAG: hypothetical protein K9J17_11545 [Flavobacteriales bacterium]|nr:hypothetical protein [Flavobacteriales bacterium]
MKTIASFSILVIMCQVAFSQSKDQYSWYENFMQVYPIGEDLNLRYMSSNTKYETILFDGNPTMKIGLYNNFIKRLMDKSKLHSMAQYVSLSPQLRMYAEKSQPVKMPSYRILLGTQHLFRLKVPAADIARFVGFSLESGHYSNGQSGCAFSTSINDATPACDSVYALINDQTDLSAMLNRKNGNFSTNLTEFIVNYRTCKLDSEFRAIRVHSISVGYMLYHNRMFGIIDLGGFSDNDIKIFGRHRLSGMYEFVKAFSVGKKQWYQRIRLKQQFEVIIGAHPHVNPLRMETSATYYPIQGAKSLGFAVSYIYGHDNYNYRFVDAGHQATVGISWDFFPPVKLSGL